MYNGKFSRAHLAIFFITLSLILIAGFKPIDMTRDSALYVEAIKETQWNLLEKEPAFWIISDVNKLLFQGNVQTFFLLFAMLGVSIKMIAIKRFSAYPALSIYAYICLFYVLHELTQIRAGVAIGIFLLAIPDITNKKLTPYLFKCFLASMFHYSTIVMIPLYFINPLKINKKIYFFLPLLGLFLAYNPNLILQGIDTLSLILPGALGGKLSVYLLLLNDDDYNQINIFNFLYLSLFVIYFFCLYHIDKFKSKYDITLIKILAIQLFVYYALSAVPALAMRISDILGVGLIILIPKIVLIFRQKWVPLIPILLWLSAYFWIISVMRILILEGQ